MGMGSTKLELYSFVNQLHDYFSIDYDSFPIDTVDLCSRHADIQYHSFHTNGFCAAILLGEKTDTVVLNESRTPIEQNFDCGHEIIHMTKHRDLGIDTFSCMDMKSKRMPNTGFWEWEANEGSAQFLVPYYSLLPEIKKVQSLLKTTWDFRSFKSDMAEKYGVTEAVINFRFESRPEYH
ncbi:ImmA/IrrE family metallo-endopeptidase [Caproiciproducens sp. CPB-2]|uniref:ImmA/IrrE family metallo-endopeptidase n=1 Tax=Caproiciproducens sp. CPB-2 TaxID=3030017 RepID=UPI0023DAD82B|nr:ImmA/IrrE family metallo-endopeptidase [Caproiciproducens sp. CPB-2]MDF1495183.1 ImmA/IrrE family metallo-endopeptidase [Caproiciproducens sp. CPB-2]